MSRLETVNIHSLNSILNLQLPNRNKNNDTIPEELHDCVNYTTLNARLSRLKVLKKCTICLSDSHKGQNCNVQK
ncbi:unnamed protein product [Brugia pahangi]|uniref:Uncharacterized protein n=1 Tax=Brugia pahangi TaxID=6280 RepID=A0A0N4T911_BRUPA|nr:unnamed protein product [Brugia pahangi]